MKGLFGKIGAAVKGKLNEKPMNPLKPVDPEDLVDRIRDLIA